MLIVLLAGCGRQEDEQLPEESTITIYDHKNDQKLPCQLRILRVVAGEMKPGWPLKHTQPRLLLSELTMDSSTAEEPRNSTAQMCAQMKPTPRHIIRATSMKL